MSMFTTSTPLLKKEHYFLHRSFQTYRKQTKSRWTLTVNTFWCQSRNIIASAVVRFTTTRKLRVRVRVRVGIG